MSEHYEQNNYQEDKEQLIFETTTDGRDKSKQLIEILGNNDIFLKNAAVLSLDVELGGEIMFAEIPNVSNLTATEPNHPNGDIPDYADEDDPLHAVPVHEIHKGILNELSLSERQKVQIHRETAESALDSFKNSGHSFDLVTRFNIFPHKLESRIEGIARDMLSVTKPGGVVIITTQEGDDTILNLLSQKLQNDPEISRIHVQPVSGDSKETPMEALGALAIIIQKN